jgi:hypothetical protein
MPDEDALLGDAPGEDGSAEAAAAAAGSWWPLRPPVSGRYQWTSYGRRSPRPSATPSPGAADDARGIVLPSTGPEDTQGVWPIWLSSETVRVDVDGRYPQMTVSGEVVSGLAVRVHWIAELAATGDSSWEGPIWYRHGNELAMPYTDVRVTAARAWYVNQRSVTIEFLNGSVLRRRRTYAWRSEYFRDVEFEFDRTSDAHPVTEILTGAHSNRPEGLRRERLSIAKVYERAGFRVSMSGGDSEVPLSGAGSNGTWSDAEMHDAMVAYWSRFADRPRWTMWTFWCALHDQGTSLGGIMFDDIGPNHRQGTAIFTEAFISRPPANDAEPDAWVARMRFWTAVHEMGHAFNLAHAWQKNLGASWIPLANEAESRSFMNYPYRVAGGERRFFSDFQYAFSDQELLFMRHAPEAFVQMGNADWFDDHGFRQAEPDLSGLRLEVRMHRAGRVFEFMEPVNLELKLANDGAQPAVVDAGALRDGDDLTVIIKRDGRPARQWHPYASYARQSDVDVIRPGEARYAPLSISTGLNGADLAEPGNYIVQVALDVGGAMVVSPPLSLRVGVPRNWEQEDLAGDFFTDDVNRTMALGGTQVMTGANRVLENVADRFPTSRVALHARAALATPRLRDFKFLDFADGRETAGAPVVAVERSAIAEAAPVLMASLVGAGDEAADSFGHIELHERVDRLSAALDDAGDAERAAACQDALRDTLSGRGVLPSVLAKITAEAEAYRPGPAKKKPSAKKTTAKKTSARKTSAKKTSAKNKTASKTAPAKKKASPRRGRSRGTGS